MDSSSQVILRLFPYTPGADKAMRLGHNQNFVDGELIKLKQADIASPRDESSGPTRQNTPEVEKIPAFCLRLDRLPKNLKAGWVFGRNPEYCDVILSGIQRMSNRHFRIHFNQETGLVVITDTSTNGTVVNSKLLKRGTEVLVDNSHISIPDCDIGLQIVFPTRTTDGSEYKNNVEKYLSSAKSSRVKLLPGPISDTPRCHETHGEYKLLCELGVGAFGSVHKMTDRSGFLYAGKKFKDANASVVREVRIFKSVSHANIIAFKEEVRIKNEPWVIMEFAPLGSLESRYRERGQRPIFPRLCRMVRQIGSALQYLHALNILHRDVKPGNILIACMEPDVFKLADFGLSTDRSPNTFCGTPLYLAPEVRQGGYSAAVDMWSFGVTILSMLRKLPLFTQNTPERYMEYVDRLRNSTAAGMEKYAGSDHEVMYRLIDSLISQEPIDRLSAEECVRFVAQITDKRKPVVVDEEPSSTKHGGREAKRQRVG